MADQSGDDCLHQPLAKTDFQAIAVSGDVRGLDVVLGVDLRRGDSLALYLVLCSSGRRIRRLRHEKGLDTRGPAIRLLSRRTILLCRAPYHCLVGNFRLKFRTGQ